MATNQLAVTTSVSDPSRVYATFTVRFRALVTGWLVQCSSLVLVMLAATAAEDVPGAGRMAFALFFAIIVLYEPLQVARYGRDQLIGKWAGDPDST